VAQLSLDEVERHALAGQLKRMCMTELVERKPAPYSRSGSKAAELDPDSGRRPGTTFGRTVDHAEQRADRHPGITLRNRPPVALGRYPDVTVKHSALTTIPTPAKPALSEEQRAERLRLLAERLRSPDGLDRDTLKHVEQLTDTER